MKKYSINELAKILNVTRTAVNRKIDKYGFETVQEYVNGKPLKLVTLTDEQIEALKKETQYFKNVNTVSQNTYETNLNNVTPETQENFGNSSSLVETMLKELRYYADTAINAEKEKVFLIEDKARQDKDTLEYYRGEISRLTQELNVIKQENEKLKEELSKKQLFFGLFKKPSG